MPRCQPAPPMFIMKNFSPLNNPLPMVSRWILYPVLIISGILAMAVAMIAVVLILAYPNLPSLEILTDYRPKIPLRVYTPLRACSK